MMVVFSAWQYLEGWLDKLAKVLYTVYYGFRWQMLSLYQTQTYSYRQERIKKLGKGNNSCCILVHTTILRLTDKFGPHYCLKFCK